MYVESDTRRGEKNSLRGRDELAGDGDRDRDRIELNRIAIGAQVQAWWFKGIFSPLPRFHYPVDRETSNSNIAIALHRGTVIDSSLPARNATGERVYTHTIARQTRSHAQDSNPVEMKLGRGVEIPPLPLLNWNLIARPRCSITSACVFSAPMQIIGCTRVSRRDSRIPPRLRTDFSQLTTCLSSGGVEGRGAATWPPDESGHF